MAEFVFKVKSKSGQQIVKNLTSVSTIGDLKTNISNVTNINRIYLNILYGFPPKPLDLSVESKTLVEAGISSGETFIVEEKVVETNNGNSINHKNEEPNRIIEEITSEISTNGKNGVLMKKVVPSDNSCLFTSIGFVLNGKVDTSVGNFMRQIIAKEVSGDAENYNEAILGKPNEDYCDWIQKPASWGGAIEVSVLSRFYGIEMDVVDTLNAIINRFGEDQNYGQRVFLLFDGVHYDPLYLEQIEGGVQTLFPIEDMEIFKEAEQLAREAKSSRQYTDLNKFTLRCLVCDKMLTGQVEAQKHAKDTQHTNFGEV